jgi:hypothetical protein
MMSLDLLGLNLFVTFFFFLLDDYKNGMDGDILFP